MNTTDNTEMNAVVVEAPKRRVRVKAKMPVEEEVALMAPVDAEPPEAPPSDAEEAPPKKSSSVSIALTEFKRLRAIEKEFNEMKEKYDAMVEKEKALKAKRNEASKKSKAKQRETAKEIKAKLEERVEKLEKAVLKAEEKAEESEADEQSIQKKQI